MTDSAWKQQGTRRPMRDASGLRLVATAALVALCRLPSPSLGFAPPAAFKGGFAPATRPADAQLCLRSGRLMAAGGLPGVLEGAGRRAGGSSILQTLVARVVTKRVGGLSPAPEAVPGRKRSVPGVENPVITGLLEQAKAADRAGNVADARELYERIVGMDAENGKVWMKMFLLCRREKDYARGREVLRRSLTHLPGNAILWQAWADMERTLGKHEVARNLYAKAMEANPHLASLYNAWGGMERELGNADKARQLLSTGLKRNPKSARLHLSLAVLEDVAGNTGVAHKFLSRGLGLEPRNAHLHHAMGLLEYKRRALGEARERFRVATEVDGDFTMAWLSWGRMEEELGHAEAARDKYAAGCRARGRRGSVQLWQAWARLEEKRGEWWEATEVYAQGSRLYPRDPLLLVEWAKLVERRGDAGQAAKLLGRALDVDGSNPYVLQCYASLEARQLRYSAARALFERGLEAASARGARDEARMLHAWARMESGLGEVGRARELFERASALGVEEAWLFRWYARLEGEHGDVWLARHFFARAVNANPLDPEPWKEWGELEEASGNADRARTYMARHHSLAVSKGLEGGRIDARKPLGRKWRRHS